MYTPHPPTTQAKYGALVQHRWFGDGYILLGFANGYAVAISTHAREVGQELWQVRNHRDQLTAVAVSPPAVGWLASAGSDGTVRVHATANLKETVCIVQLPAAMAGGGSGGGGGGGGVRSIDWSADGQLMAVSTQSGALLVYVMQLGVLFAVRAPRVAMLSSLAEVTLYGDVAVAAAAGGHPAGLRQQNVVVQLEIEPTFLALGERHLACGMNNHVWFYELGDARGGGPGGRTRGGGADEPIMLGDREYLAEISEVRLNGAWCAVLCGGKVMLHSIEATTATTAGGSMSDGGGEGGRMQRRQPQVFPGSVQGMQETVITCMALTPEFLVFATDVSTFGSFTARELVYKN